MDKNLLALSTDQMEWSRVGPNMGQSDTTYRQTAGTPIAKTLKEGSVFLFYSDSM